MKYSRFDIWKICIVSLQWKYVLFHFNGKYVLFHFSGKYVPFHFNGKYVTFHFNVKYVLFHFNGKYVLFHFNENMYCFTSMKICIVSLQWKICIVSLQRKICTVSLQWKICIVSLRWKYVLFHFNENMYCFTSFSAHVLKYKSCEQKTQVRLWLTISVFFLSINILIGYQLSIWICRKPSFWLVYNCQLLCFWRLALSIVVEVFPLPLSYVSYISEHCIAINS